MAREVVLQEARFSRPIRRASSAGALAASFAVTAWSPRAYADDSCCSRSVWVAPTYQLLFTDTFDPSSRHGLGAAASYDFHVSSRFNLGLHLAYRLYPGEQQTHQVGYGAILKHFFSDHWSTEDGVYPFVDYGLLLQQTLIHGRRGSAVSHDSRLGIGLVTRASGVPLFISTAGHYSRLTFFDRDSEWIPYLDVHFGWMVAY